MLGRMLRFPNQFARKRMLRFYLGPTLAGLIVGAGAFYYFGQAKAPALVVEPTPPLAAAVATAPFRNCAQARAAGAAPVLRGQPGYGPHLDADGDGVGCEPYRGR